MNPDDTAMWDGPLRESLAQGLQITAQAREGCWTSNGVFVDLDLGSPENGSCEACLALTLTQARALANRLREAILDAEGRLREKAA